MVVRTMAASDIVKPKKDQPMADKAVSTGKGKRKAEPEAEICPIKKPKTINDGFCVFIGNLNKTKNYDEVKLSIANYLTTESLLVQDIRLHSNRTYAYVDLASEMDLTKALTLNGKKLLDLPLRVSKAKVKVTEDKKRKRAKPTPEQKAAKFSKWLSVTNLPHNATKGEVMSIFKTAVDVKFPGGTAGPSRGIAILHFKTKELAEKAMKKKRGKKLGDLVMKINPYRSKKELSVNEENTRAVAPKSVPNNALILKNLPRLATEDQLKKIFKKAVGINIPRDGSNARGFAFVEFKTVKDTEDAMVMAQDLTILKKAIHVEYCKTMFRPESNEVLLTTLIVSGLAEGTGEETLKAVFEGCTSTRVIRDKRTTKSKGFGFVEFAQKEDCKAAKEAMEDCEIDGKKVTLAYAKPQTVHPTPQPKTQPNGKSKQPAKGQPKQKPESQPKAQPGDESKQPAKGQPKRKPESQPKAQPGDESKQPAKGQPKRKPESQPKAQPGDEPKPGPKEQPSGDESKRPKRKRNKKKGPKPAAQVEAKEDGADDGAEDGAMDGAEDATKEAEVKE